MPDNYPEKNFAEPMKHGSIDGAEAEEEHASAEPEVPEAAESPVVVSSESAVSFTAAMEAAGSGGKVRRNGWANDHAYITDRGEGLIVVLPRPGGKEYSGPYDAGPVDSNSNDWEILPE